MFEISKSRLKDKSSENFQVLLKNLARVENTAADAVFDFL
jgi:hypothetical protein